MAQVRVKGYVVGYDEVGGEVLWKVKVKDPSSVHSGSKFVVHSLHPGTMLSRPSVDVTFKVAPIQVGQEQVLKAVDVAIGEVSSLTMIPHTETESGSEDAIHFYASKLNDESFVWFTGLQSMEAVEVELKGSDEELLEFFKIACCPFEKEGNVDFQNSMRVIHGLLCNDTFREAFEFILSRIFSLARSKGFIMGMISTNKKEP